MDMNFQQILRRQKVDGRLLTKKSEKKETAQNTKGERLKIRRGVGGGGMQGSSNCFMKSQSQLGLTLRN